MKAKFLHFINYLRSLSNYWRFIRYSPLVLPKILVGVIKTVIFKQNVLRVVEIAVNYRCNSHCIFCSAVKLLDPAKENKLFTPKDYQKIGHDLDKMGTIGIVLTGGEPMLRIDITEIIKALGPRNKIISLVTNSLLLTRDKVFALKKAGLNALEFSIESDNEIENDKLRGIKGHYQKVMQGVEWAREAGLNVCFSPCLSHQNLKNFPRFIKFAQNNKAFILLSLAGIVGRWSEKDKFRLTSADWKKMRTYQEKYPFIRNDFDTNYSLRAGCPAGREKFYLTAYGDIIPCSFTHLSFGNINKEPLPKIFNRMGKFSYYAKASPYCLRTMDQKYIGEVLEPLNKSTHLPLSVSRHPLAELRKLALE